MNEAYFTTEASPPNAINSANVSTFTPIAATALTGSSGSAQDTAISPDGAKLYVGDSTNGNVYLIAAATLAIVTTITLPGFTAGRLTLWASADGTRVYAASRADSLVTVLNSTTLATITTFAVTNQPTGMADTPNAAVLYITQETGASVDVINTVSYTPITSITVGTVPLAIVMAPNGLTAYCLNDVGATVSVISTATNLVTTTISPPAGVTNGEAIAISPDGKYLYVTSATSAEAWQITTSSATVTDHFTLSNQAAWVAIDPTSTHVWFSEDSPANQIEVFNVPADTLAATIAGLVSPNQIVMTPAVTPPPTPSYPGSQFIPKLFIPQKGKVSVDYTGAELMANWIAIEIWSQRWLPPAPVALFFPNKNSTDPNALNANWIVMENWVNQINQAEKAPYPTLFIPRKASNRPTDLDVDFLRVQDWANGL